MSKESNFEAKGVVKKALGNGSFAVEVNIEGKILPVKATLAGKVRMHRIKVTEGDSVTLRISQYDITNGIITFREKN